MNLENVVTQLKKIVGGKLQSSYLQLQIDGFKDPDLTA